MKQEGYILLMLKQLSARGSLFLFVRTHHHLQYYFDLSDTRGAANQAAMLNAARAADPHNVVEIHPLPRPSVSQRF